MRHISLLGLTLTLGGAVDAANASCGAAFCSLNSGLEAQDIGNDRGTLFDLRYEHIMLDQPRSGSSRLRVGEAVQDHDEVRTRNDNVVATLDYAFTPQWGITARLPYVDRRHTHIRHDPTQDVLERWHLTGFGDMQVTARYALHRDLFGGSGVRAGLKLPTGKFHETNADGERAERSLQPGSGTTDVVVGGYYTRAMVPHRLNAFGQLSLQAPLTGREAYRPGPQFTADFGVRYSLFSRTTALAQINAIYKSRDRGDRSEPRDSGGRYVFFSPGLSHALPRDWQIYSYAQLPLYQYVNGVQLTAKWTAVAGLVRRF